MQGDNNNDAWIFTLTLLLSSTLVYNSMHTIDQQGLDQLRYGDEWEGGDTVMCSHGGDSIHMVTVLMWVLQAGDRADESHTRAGGGCRSSS